MEVREFVERSREDVEESQRAFTVEERDRLSPLNPNYAVCLFGGGPLTKGAALHCYRLC